MLKSVIHKHSDDLELQTIIRKGLDNKIKENNLQLVENNKKIEALKKQIEQMENRLIDTIQAHLNELGAKSENHETRLSNLENNRC
ncbi:MAG: hypothetical protein KKE11_04975 [Gammaproteobacteria bacterium]|nr:hypothetical protein [Gammaproteobacteria bacterium]